MTICGGFRSARWRWCFFGIRQAGVGRWTLWLALAVACLVTADAPGALRHQYSFNDGTANDSVGSAHGTLHGNATFSSSQLILDGTPETFVDLLSSGPNGININTYPAVTITVWATPSSTMGTLNQYTTLLGFGAVNTTNANLAANYFHLQTHRGDNVSRAAIAISNDADPFSEEDFADGPEYNNNLQHQYAVVLTNSSISLYTDGALRETAALPVNGADNMISGISTDFARIGSSYPIDPLFVGTVNNIRIYDEARTAAQIAADFPPCCDFVPPRLTIDRTTGKMTLTYLGGLPSNVVGYSISSAAGSLNPAAWQSIADNYDADSGTSIIFDSDDNWTILSAPGSNTDFSEFEFDGGDGGKLGAGGTTSLQIGGPGAWRKSFYEDLEIEMRLADGSDLPVQIVYTGGICSGPCVRSDLNFDGAIDIDDWNLLLAHAGATFSNMSVAESYAFGDLNGDLVSDHADFRLFKTDYFSANGAGAWAALAGLVPEPGTGLLVLAAVVCLTGRCWRRGSGLQFHAPPGWVANFRRGRRFARP